jgi:hypothetical protein
LARCRVCSFQLLLGIASAVFLGYESYGTREYILLFLFLRLPNLEDQVPVFISPRNRGLIKNVTAVTNTRATIEKLIGMSFSLLYVSYEGKQKIRPNCIRILYE